MNVHDLFTPESRAEYDRRRRESAERADALMAKYRSDHASERRQSPEVLAHGSEPWKTAISIRPRPAACGRTSQSRGLSTWT